MTKKYVFVRINAEDYSKLMIKKEGLTKDMESILGKKINFPMTQFFTAVAKGVLEIDPQVPVNLRLFKITRRPKNE